MSPIYPVKLYRDQTWKYLVIFHKNSFSLVINSQLGSWRVVQSVQKMILTTGKKNLTAQSSHHLNIRSSLIVCLPPYLESIKVIWVTCRDQVANKNIIENVQIFCILPFHSCLQLNRSHWEKCLLQTWPLKNEIPLKILNVSAREIKIFLFARRQVGGLMLIV